MGLNDIQSHILQNIPDATELVDLLKLARERSRRDGRLKLVLDGECCLDRLYGGFYPDWVCSGQFDKMFQFLRNFSVLVQNSNLDLVVFFNGTIESDRCTEILHQYQETYRLLEEITRHVNTKKKPPPKIWWLPPAYLRSALRLTFRWLDMKTMCTIEDHHKDISRFCQRHRFHGIIADDPEYLVFDANRYFSAQKLKMTYGGSLETVEVKLKKVFDTFNVPKERIFIFSALLGNHILTTEDLKEFFASLDVSKNNSQSKVEKVAEFTRELESKDPEKIAAIVVAKSLNKTENVSEEEKEKSRVLAAKIVKCLQYYGEAKAAPSSNKSKYKKTKKEKQNQKNAEKQAAKISTSTVTTSSSAKPLADTENSNSTKLDDTSKSFDVPINETAADVAASTLPETSSSSPLPNGTAPAKEPAEDKKQDSTVAKLAYRISPTIEDVASNRHVGGVMSPYICQIFKHKEIKLPLIIEDVRTSNTELPRSREVFRPLRQRIYGVLFNLHHLQFLAKQRNEKTPRLQVKETYFCTRTKTMKTDTVSAEEIGWGIPTIEKLWLGEGDECKNKRIRAFLTLMKSENRLMLDPSIVPQQMIALACVLRYIVSSDKKVLRQNEFEALIAQAFIQDLTDPNLAQEIEVSNLTMRGVHLSHLFMDGVEMCLLANDACGAPLNYGIFCPWFFFNGKIFNYVLEQQAKGRTLNEICGYKSELLCIIEQVRLAVLDGVKVNFAPDPVLRINPNLMRIRRTQLMPQHAAQLQQQQSRVPYGLQNSQSFYGAAAAYGGGFDSLLIPRSRSAVSYGLGTTGQGLSGASLRNLAGSVNNGTGYFGASPAAAAAAAALYNNTSFPGRQRRVQPRGGTLEIAGQIVGSWGANFGPTQGTQRVSRNSVLSSPHLHHGSQLASLMNPLSRISGGGATTKVFGNNRNNRVVTAGNHLSHKRANKNPKKSIMKKSGENSGKQEGSKQTNGASAATPSTENIKPKGVSFKIKDEAKTILPAGKEELGAGDAPIAEAVALRSLEEDSPAQIHESSLENNTSETYNNNGQAVGAKAGF